MKKMKFLLVAIIAVGMSNLGYAQWSLTGNASTNPSTNYVGTSDSIDLVVRTNGNERMRILRTGQIGIGVVPTGITNYGGGLFSVPPILQISGKITETNPGGTFPVPIVTIAEKGTNNKLTIGATSRGPWLSTSGTDTCITFLTKVAIGNNITSIGGTYYTLPTGYNLYVAGGVLTEKVKVAVKTTASWADYVFNKNYKLLSLAEVETYIKKNKHLPGVPSAEEVVKEGIDMATMDAKLLEKIEELTLYLIELKKENQQMQKEIELLRISK